MRVNDGPISGRKTDERSALTLGYPLGCAIQQEEAHMATGGWGVLVAIVLALLWVALAYNRLRVLHHRVETAYGQIDVQLKRRHDLIPNLVEVARAHMVHEAATLEAVIRARCIAQGAASTAAGTRPARAMGALAMAEQSLNGQLGQFRLQAEAYPQLQDDERMLQLREALGSTENRMGLARRPITARSRTTTAAPVAFPICCWRG
jgi:LemA protein